MAAIEAGINLQLKIPDVQRPSQERPTVSTRTQYISGQIKDLGKRINAEFKAIKGRITGITETEKQDILTTEVRSEQTIQEEMTALTSESTALIHPNHDTAPIITTSDKTPVTAQKYPPLYPKLTRERLEEIWKENGERAMKELEEEIKNSKAVEYPDDRVLDVAPSSTEIAESVDRYVTWRCDHEKVEGVKEPGRANILGHATSVEGARSIILEGSLRSIKNLLCSDNPRVDLMQGGKARYIAGTTRELVETDPVLQQAVLEERMKVLEYTPWLDAETKSTIMQQLQTTTTIPDLMNIVNNIVDAGIRQGVWPNMSRPGVFERHPPWNFITNLLPKDARQKIASAAHPEGYVSTTLGHALEIYTPDKTQTSRQAAVVTLDVGQIPRQDIHMGGGTNDYRQATDFEWEMTVKRTAGLPAKIFTHEVSYGGDAMEINIEDSNPEGTAIPLPNVVILLPSSQEQAIRQTLPPGEDGITRLDRVIWFDDAKFRSVDEALGWLVTTPEGKALYQNRISSEPIQISVEA